MKLLRETATQWHQSAIAGETARISSTAWSDPLYVDAGPLLARHLTGIGRFTARLVEALARITPLRLINTIGGEHAQNMRLLDTLPCGWEMSVARGDLPGADDDVQQWARCLLQRPMKHHDDRLARKCTGLYTFVRPNEKHFQKELAILYDFTPVLLPWAHVHETREHFGKLFCYSSAQCDKLIAISEATRHDARWLCARPHNDVVVGYPGPSMCVRRHTHPHPVERRDNVILVVSTLEPRKNGPFLFDWFMNTDVFGREVELWWVGPDGWLCALPRNPAGRKAGQRKVKFLGMIPDNKLCELYRTATFTIYPSLYEGFGFPVLDSLRHGTPVLCTYNSSLCEFEGPGVHYFDPCDTQSLDAACRELLSSGPAEVKRSDLNDRFSWDALARKVLALAA